MQINLHNSIIDMHLSILRWFTLCSSCFCLATSAYSATPDNLFFLHHSTGNGLITGGDMRGVIDSYNTAHGTSFAFWDHGYNSDELRDPDGNETGTSYEIPNDDTNPDGLHYLWTSTESAGESAGTEADWWVIAFAQGSGKWYYLNSSMEWIIFSGDTALCQSAYQGPLFNLASTTVLNERILPYGTFNFYFAVDQRDGIMNYPEGPILYDLATVIVE